MSSRESLAALVIAKARRQNKTIATAESCTGGWIAKTLTDIPGSSSVLLGGLVTYSNASKQSLLGVTHEALSNGAVSEPVVIQMADAARKALGSDIAISVSGVAGPSGGSASKPIGTVWIALSAKGKKTLALRQDFGNKGRHAVRKLAVIYALEWIQAELDM